MISFSKKMKFLVANPDSVVGRRFACHYLAPRPPLWFMEHLVPGWAADGLAGGVSIPIGGLKVWPNLRSTGLPATMVLHSEHRDGVFPGVRFDRGRSQETGQSYAHSCPPPYVRVRGRSSFPGGRSSCLILRLGIGAGCRANLRGCVDRAIDGTSVSGSCSRKLLALIRHPLPAIGWKSRKKTIAR